MKWRILKFPLEVGIQSVAMPAHSEPLAFQAQGGRLTLWAKCPVGSPTAQRWFRVVGTGWEFGGEFEEYVGTAQVSGFVWHLFAVLR